MEAFICPECGGRVDPPAMGSEYAKCTYCATSFRVDRAVPLFHGGPATAVDERQARAAPLIVILVIIGIVTAGFFFAMSRMSSVRTQTHDTVNAAQRAQKTADDARAAANAAARSAQEMVNKAERTFRADNPVSSPTPAKRPMR